MAAFVQGHRARALGTEGRNGVRRGRGQLLTGSSYIGYAIAAAPDTDAAELHQAASHPVPATTNVLGATGWLRGAGRLRLPGAGWPVRVRKRG